MSQYQNTLKLVFVFIENDMFAFAIRIAFVIRFSSLFRLVQLCAAHWSDRESLLKQAGKKDKELVFVLNNMERSRPEEFAEHVGNFSVE